MRSGEADPITGARAKSFCAPTKPSRNRAPHLMAAVELKQEAHMRRMVFAIALLAVASAGISASFAAVHQARTLTFAERFAPALPLMVNH